MSSRKEHAQSITDAIRQVLVRDWDPIGVMDDPNCPRDEYDLYVGAIYGHLARGEPAEFIARYLCRVEEDLMGLGPVPASARLSVAAALKALDVSLHGHIVAK